MKFQESEYGTFVVQFSRIRARELVKIFEKAKRPWEHGGVAQLGEHLPCKQGVMGSNPIISTISESKGACALGFGNREVWERETMKAKRKFCEFARSANLGSEPHHLHQSAVPTPNNGEVPRRCDTSNPEELIHRTLEEK